jgi:hypothetical protein
MNSIVRRGLTVIVILSSGGAAAVYINSDGNSRGFFSAGGSHTLEKFVNRVVEGSRRADPRRLRNP